MSRIPAWMAVLVVASAGGPAPAVGYRPGRGRRRQSSCWASARSAPKANGARPTPRSIKERRAGGRHRSSSSPTPSRSRKTRSRRMRSFIAQKVDVIAFSPVVETGWDTVLREAKAAGIPVMLTDRAVEVSDDIAVRHAASARTSSRKAAGRRAGWSRTAKAAARRHQHRRAAGNRGLRAGQRSQEGLRGDHRRRTALQDHPLADRRLHARQGQGSHGGLPQGRRQEDQRAVRAQRRHGHRRDPGHRGSRPEARRRTSASSRSTA